MTEDEAKMKWCPHVVASHTDPRQAPSQYEREAGVTSPFRHNCIASDCMAWRTLYVERGPVIERMAAAPGSSKPEGEDWGYEAIDPMSVSRGGYWVRWAPGVAHGYCGLAGVPQ